MLVARFGPTTGWAGRKITHDGGVFTLEGFGPVLPSVVMEYDRQVHLVWTNDGTRAWVASKVATENAPPPVRRELVYRQKSERPQRKPLGPVPDPSANARYMKRNPSDDAVWHIIQEGIHIYTRGGEYEGPFLVSYCGQTVYPDAEISRELSRGAGICKRCLRYAAEP